MISWWITAVKINKNAQRYPFEENLALWAVLWHISQKRHKQPVFGLRLFDSSPKIVFSEFVLLTLDLKASRQSLCDKSRIRFYIHFCIQAKSLFDLNGTKSQLSKYTWLFDSSKIQPSHRYYAVYVLKSLINSLLFTPRGQAAGALKQCLRIFWMWLESFACEKNEWKNVLYQRFKETETQSTAIRRSHLSIVWKLTSLWKNMISIN